MKTVALYLAIFIALGPPAALAAEKTPWPELLADGGLSPLIADARKLSFDCESELASGPEGNACGAYRQAALRVNSIVAMRLRWCLRWLDTPNDYPIVCAGEINRFAEIRWPVIEGLSRQRDPQWWAKFDAANAEINQ